MVKLKKHKGIIGFIIGIILTSGISVYATATYLYNATEVGYNNTSVSIALDDLYSKVPAGTISISTKDNEIDVSKYQYADTTALYTATEAQSGQGIYWNSDSFSVTTSTTVNLNIGFTPSFLCITNVANGSSIVYKSSISTTQQYILGNVRNLGTRTDGGSSIVSIGTTTKFQSAANSSWYWVAIK